MVAMRKTGYIFIVFLFINLLSKAQSQQDSLDIYLGKFQYNKAIEYIDRQEPTKELMLQKASCYKALRDYKASSMVLQVLAYQFPDDVKVKFDLATSLESEGMLQAAIDCYNELLGLDSANVYFKTRKAELLFMDRVYDEALVLYHNIYDETKSITPLNRAGQCYERMNDLDSAQYYYYKAWGLDSANTFAAASLVNLNLKTKQYDNAIDLSEIYIWKDTTNQQMNLLNALGYYGKENYDESALRFYKCYQAGDSSLIVNRSLGISYYSLDDYYSAYPFLENAFRQDTLDNNVLYFLAVTSNNLGEYEKSISFFNKLLGRVIPADGMLYLCYKNLASAYSTGSIYDKAVESYIKALDYCTDYQDMMLYYHISSLTEYNLNDKKKALHYYNLYKKSLHRYIEELKNESNQTNTPEIDAIAEQITELEKHIRELEKAVPDK